MPKFSLQWIANSTQGQIESDIFTQGIGIGTDTRNDLSDQVFIALRGANFDAHNFLAKAVDKGAKILIIDKKSAIGEELKKRVSIVLVEDTLKALQDMATVWRTECKSQFMAITGSNGKTTTKEFAASIISTKFKVYASHGSFNNHWGVPLSLLQVEKDHQVTILEMGMNRRGELTRLCEISQPTVVLVTMVGSAHIGMLGSQEEIVKAKKEIYESCEDCIKIFNKDNEYTIAMYTDYLNKGGGRHFTFSSFDKSASVSLRVEQMELGAILLSGHINNIEGQTRVPIFGRHNINNIMAASCLALAAGMSGEEIWKALPLCRGAWGRNQLYTLQNGAQILFDAYNASFDSTSALIKNLYEIDFKGTRLAVIGQMLELGEKSPSLHEKLGELIAQAGFDTIWFIGPDREAFGRGIERGKFSKNLILSDTYEEKLALQVGSMLNPQDVAIIKGSRGMKLEKILDSWRAHDLL
ncbi:MAG: UDP-N-acetylmuramoyl-tripeptide--D-alanyl-D-alanine ligase [Bdellovibrionaceae bacterium]|nr:UDP-N-acetylmuramoyl-tripeptide--D-alanyl-D-alanine ligase [Pseudobdellovibrionaceae bacterium]